MLIHVTDLTKKVTSLYRKYFFDYLKLLIWLLIPTTLSAIVLTLPLSVLTIKTITAALWVITGIVSLWLSVALVDMTLSLVKNDSVKISYSFSWETFWRIIDLILVSFLQGIIVMVGFLLFIIPGIIFLVWFSFAKYAVLIDKKSPGSEAFKTSKKLVTGKFWPIVWRWIGSYLYFGIFFGLITMLLLVVIGALLGNPGIAFNLDKEIWWSNLIAGVISTLITPIFVAIGVILYEDAKK